MWPAPRISDICRLRAPHAFTNWEFFFLKPWMRRHRGTARLGGDGISGSVPDKRQLFLLSEIISGSLFYSTGGEKRPRFAARPSAATCSPKNGLRPAAAAAPRSTPISSRSHVRIPRSSIHFSFSAWMIFRYDAPRKAWYPYNLSYFEEDKCSCILIRRFDEKRHDLGVDVLSFLFGRTRWTSEVLWLNAGRIFCKKGCDADGETWEECKHAHVLSPCS